jgi:Uma2 family endonuclease
LEAGKLVFKNEKRVYICFKFYKKMVNFLEPVKFRLDHAPISDADFLRFCQLNPDLRVEMDKNKYIKVMPLTYSDTGNFNYLFSGKTAVWHFLNNMGLGFDSSSGFRLPNGAVRSPDFSWIEKSRWEALGDRKKHSFAPICPDFVAEICSKTDLLNDAKEKMAEYMECGCRLAWLIMPIERETWIYRAGGTSPEKIGFDQILFGENVLEGFEIRLSELLGN